MPRSLIQITMCCLLLAASCNRSNPKYQTVDKFLDYARQDNSKGIISLIDPQLDYEIADTFKHQFNTHLAHKLITKYGVPAKKLWFITYDTLSTFKKITINVPLFHGPDEANRVIDVGISVSFDYTGKHSQDNQIIEYDVDVGHPILR